MTLSYEENAYKQSALQSSDGEVNRWIKDIQKSRLEEIRDDMDNLRKQLHSTKKICFEAFEEKKESSCKLSLLGLDPPADVMKIWNTYWENEATVKVDGLGEIPI